MRVNKTPKESGKRKVVELLAAHGPMTARQIIEKIHGMNYDALKNHLRRGVGIKVLKADKSEKPFVYSASDDWHEVLNVPEIPRIKPDFTRRERLPDSIPAQHPLIAAWMPPRFETMHLQGQP